MSEQEPNREARIAAIKSQYIAMQFRDMFHSKLESLIRKQNPGLIVDEDSYAANEFGENTSIIQSISTQTADSYAAIAEDLESLGITGPLFSIFPDVDMDELKTKAEQAAAQYMEDLKADFKVYDDAVALVEQTKSALAQKINDKITEIQVKE